MEETTPLVDRSVDQPKYTVFRVVNYAYSVLLPGIFISMIVMGAIYYPQCHKAGVSEIPTLLIVLGSLGVIEELWRHIPFYEALYYFYLVACIIALWICSDIDLDVNMGTPLGHKYCTTGLFVFNTVMILMLNVLLVIIVILGCVRVCMGLRSSR